MLKVNKLSVRFRQHDGSRLAPIEDVSFTLGRGELVGLVGGSGAGKSLIAEALIGALPRNAEVSGAVSLNGSAPQKGAIALAPQGRDALDPLAPSGRQVARFARLARVSCDVPQLFADLGLPPSTVKLWPHELSGGMAKRVLVATALATGADYLIADEPTVGLDGASADRIMALLADLAVSGRAVLVISHDLVRLARVACRMVILEEGRQVEVADAAAFAEDRLVHPFSRALWQAQTWEHFASEDA